MRLRGTQTLLACLLVAGLAAPARGQGKLSPSQQARKLEQEAMVLLQKRNTMAACRKFKQAHAVLPDKEFLKSLAVCYRLAFRYRQSMETYRRYWENFPEPRRSEELRRLEKELRHTRHCEVSVSTNPAKAQVLLGDKVYGFTPARGPLKIVVPGSADGPHKLALELGGHMVLRRELICEYGEAMKLDLDLHGTLVVSSNVRDTTIELGSEILGRTPLRRKLPAGKHALRARAPGYHGHFFYVTIRPGAVALAPVKLQPSSRPFRPPPEPTPRGGMMAFLLAGPAIPFLGEEGRMDTTAVVTLGGGHLWRSGRLGLQVHGAVTYSPFGGRPQDDTVHFLDLTGGAGGRLYITQNLWAELSLAVGASLLLGVTADTVFIRGATTDGDTFAGLVLRPALRLGWTFGNGLTLLASPLTLDYYPRAGAFEAFEAPYAVPISRLCFSVGLGFR